MMTRTRKIEIVTAAIKDLKRGSGFICTSLQIALTYEENNYFRKLKQSDFLLLFGVKCSEKHTPINGGCVWNISNKERIKVLRRALIKLKIKHFFLGEL